MIVPRDWTTLDFTINFFPLVSRNWITRRNGCDRHFAKRDDWQENANRNLEKRFDLDHRSSLENTKTREQPLCRFLRDSYDFLFLFFFNEATGFRACRLLINSRIYLQRIGKLLDVERLLLTNSHDAFLRVWKQRQSSSRDPSTRSSVSTVLFPVRNFLAPEYVDTGRKSVVTSENFLSRSFNFSIGYSRLARFRRVNRED